VKKKKKRKSLIKKKLKSPGDDGTITGWLRHEHADWSTNNHGYNFPNVDHAGILVESRKSPEGRIGVKVSGSRWGTLSFDHPVPTCDERGLHLMVVWTKQNVKLYLGGQLVETVSIH